MGFLQVLTDALARGIVQYILETILSFFLPDEEYICIYWILVYQILCQACYVF